jgi:hypothetical protein
MTDQTYEGWSNRETWATVLHIDNDEGLHDQRNDLCCESLKVGPNTVLTSKQNARYSLARDVENWVKDMSHDVYFSETPPNQALLGMFHEIGSLWRVNWDEIASTWLEDFDEEAAA